MTEIDIVHCVIKARTCDHYSTSDEFDTLRISSHLRLTGIKQNKIQYCTFTSVFSIYTKTVHDSTRRINKIQ